MKESVALKWVLIGFLILAAPLPAVLAQSPDSSEYTFSQEELDTLLAPVALYPDALLAQILVAATYPNEVLEADRWLRQNSNLTREALNDALDQQAWDLSVKAIVPFPQILAMMSEKIDWTERLGDAFLGQEDDVVDTIQLLRARARAQGHLYDTGEQRVSAKDDIIEIAPANPQLIYVPAYDPCWAYGSWWWPRLPEYCFLPGTGVFGFASGVWVGPYWYYGWGHWDWRRHHHDHNDNHHHHDGDHHGDNHRGNHHGDKDRRDRKHHHHLVTNEDRRLNINRNLPIRNIRTSAWQHDPSRRGNAAQRGTASPQPAVQGKVGSPESRREFRGHIRQDGTERGNDGPGRQGVRSQGSEIQRRPTGESTLRSLQQHGGGSAFDGFGAGGQVRQQSERGATSRGSAGGEFRRGGSGAQGGGLHGGGYRSGAQGGGFRGSQSPGPSGGGFRGGTSSGSSGGGFHGGGSLGGGSHGGGSRR